MFVSAGSSKKQGECMGIGSWVLLLTELKRVHRSCQKQAATCSPSLSFLWSEYDKIAAEQQKSWARTLTLIYMQNGWFILCNLRKSKSYRSQGILNITTEIIWAFP